uniref:Uncharacterized protein n=1 Tax=Arundo donax TaxID=35708 RepID=A0A0A9A1F1_ARUDO
MLLSCGSTD